MKNCGIYKITNLENKKFYIGSSKNISQRWAKHKALLRHDKHENPKLQSSWNKYGEENFKFEILEECDLENLLIREQYYLDTLLFAQDYVNKINTKFDDLGLNLNPIANGNYLTEDTIQKISETLKFKYEQGIINKTHIKKCYQYNRFTGELIKIWNIVNDACRYYNTPNKKTSVIHRCLWKKTTSAFDSYWSYEPIEFIFARAPQKKYILVVQNVVEKTYAFFDSIPIFVGAVTWEKAKPTRETITKYIKSGKVFRNLYRFYKIDAPIIYDGKPFELLGTREDIITKTNEEILNVNV